MPEESQKNSPPAKKTSDRAYYFFALRIAGDFGIAIAAPIVVFVIIGQWLDSKYNSGFKLTVAAFVLAALVSGFSIYRKAKRYGVEYEKLTKK